MSIKVLIADDHEIFRLGLIDIIKSNSSSYVLAEAEDGLQAFNKIKKWKPDIAILDISMPNMNGLEVAREIKKKKIKVEIIILTIHTDEEYFKEAIDYGAKGYVLKDNSSNDILAALKFVSAGKHFLSPVLSEYLVKKNEKMTSLNNLSTSERLIIKLISGNKTSKEIADELNVSFRTVQNHRANICKKLGLKGSNSLLHFVVKNKPNL